MDGLKSLCGVLGVDFKQTKHDIHPSLDDSQGAQDLTDDTIKKFTAEIQRLREVKIQRLKKVSVFFFFFGKNKLSALLLRNGCSFFFLS